MAKQEIRWDIAHRIRRSAGTNPVTDPATVSGPVTIPEPEIESIPEAASDPEPEAESGNASKSRL